jgi:hypothetical protein
MPLINIDNPRNEIDLMGRREEIQNLKGELRNFVHKNILK